MKKTPKNQLPVVAPNTEKSVAKKFTPEEARNIILDHARMEYDVVQLTEELATELLPKFINKSPTEQKEVREKLDDISIKLMMALGTETHLPVAEAAETMYKPFAKEMAIRITKEYDCKNPSENALADMVVTSYVKVLAYTRKFNGCVSAGEHLTDERTRYLSMLSKELDRANRQFLAAFSMLRQIKSPSIEINVKAKTAFIGQNQQFNATQEIKTDDPQ